MSKPKIPAQKTLKISATDIAENVEKQLEFRQLRGKLQWEGDLDEMRLDSQQLRDWYDHQCGRKDT